MKIGITEVIVKRNNEGTMIFGESANSSKKKIRLPAKQPTQNTPCPDGVHRD
jgi:hypothetical protein